MVINHFPFPAFCAPRITFLPMDCHLDQVYAVVIDQRNGLVVLLELLNIGRRRTLDAPELGATVLELAIRHQHHVFDTH